MLAGRLAGEGARYSGSALATNLKVAGVVVFSAGSLVGGEASENLLLEDESAGIYKKLLIEDGRLAGAVLFGDTGDALWYLDLIRSRADVSPFRDLLAFGRALALKKAA